MSKHNTPSQSVSPRAQTILLAGVVAVAAVVVGYLLLFSESAAQAPAAREQRSAVALDKIPFNGARAYDYLKQLCELGPRMSGSPAMTKQQELLVKHFESLGGKVRLQAFRARHPLTGEAVPMANIIIEWHPERKERILLAAHYDTRPFPDQDLRNPRGVFIGANDGASGTALLMELARAMPDLKGKLGVDFVLFDGEELIFNDGDPYFLGSEFFAEQYIRARPRDFKYRYAVVLDMVGDADLQIFQERNSTSWEDSRGLVNDIWNTAKRLGVREFVAAKKYEISDDHVKLHSVAQIPSCDIIDFDYPYWHTTGDTPERTSALSLAKVGWVMQEWLKNAVEK